MITLRLVDSAMTEAAENSSAGTNAAGLEAEALVLTADAGATGSFVIVGAAGAPSASSKSRASCRCSSEGAPAAPSVVPPCRRWRASLVGPPAECRRELATARPPEAAASVGASPRTRTRSVLACRISGFLSA